MTVENINKYFAIDRSSKTGLREQLQDKLERFIRTAAPGTELPSERQLQEKLGISRVTVRNAIMPLFRRGLLERAPGQGTRVALGAQLSQPDQGEPLKIHQMALGSAAPQGYKKLTLALYENIPAQKEFWEYTVNSFNLFYPQNQIAIQWVPPEVTNNDYRKYLQEQSPDIFQFESDDVDDIAAPLPESLLNSWSSDHDLAGHVHGNFLTYGYSTPLTYWNEDLAQEYNITDIHQLLVAGQYYDLIAEAVAKLPESCRASGHVWDYWAMVVAGRNLTELDGAYLKKSLQILQNFANCPRAFAVTQSDSFDAVRHFVAGKQLLVTTNPAAIQAYDSQIKFRYKKLPIVGASGHQNLVVPLKLAVSLTSGHQPEARQFLQHMLSECIQNQLILRREVFPVRNLVWQRLAPRKFEFTESQAQGLRQQSFDDCNRQVYDFLIFGVRDDLGDLLNHQVDLAIVYQQIMLKWQQFKTIKG